MIYNILALADIHWGAIDAQKTDDHLYSVIRFIQEMRGEIDLIVICGDYFDYRLSLNSKAATLAVRWMHNLVIEANRNGVKAIRVIKGTEDHDNNQLEVFRDLEREELYPDGFFRIFTQNTFEETLPGLKCLYCPDENINWKDYEQKYMENLMKLPDIGFFHGSFDIVLPDIAVQESEETSAKAVIYPYGILANLIRGPIIAGHWHNAFDNEPLHYVGSFDAWAYGEENNKGFAYISYDSADGSYLYERILNPVAAHYQTIRVDTRVMHSENEYNELIEDIICMQKDEPGLMTRVVFTISDDNSKNGEYIAAFKSTFINDHTVKVVVKDLVKKAAKQRMKEESKAEDLKNAFVFDKGIKINEKIQKYILMKTGKELPIDRIDMYLKKYMGDLPFE